MATLHEWVAGARPRTLSAAVAPVLVGTGIAVSLNALLPVRAGLALGVALALQIGVNYANDYSDGIRGTDQVRVGPVRLVGQGRAPAAQVRAAAFIAFAIAAVLGLTLTALTQQWWLLGVGVVSIAAAWFYTGGPRPYGYAGLGEVFVLVFFGIVPVMGTAYVQTLTFTAPMLLAGIAVGLLSSAILIANNLRDIPTDIHVGKHTLATRIGDLGTRRLYVGVVMLAFVIVIVIAASVAWIVLITLVSAIAAIRPMRAVLAGAQGKALIPVLQSTSLLLIVFSVLLTCGFVLVEILRGL
jgi:1,4-dihydroxy-2-naphthoate polyprenyltransferase